ncbi:response regulator [Psychroflexus sp. YR1-1]|uniref:Response regulator n=1 Tax=Psychroflexus aurantiacus TaxID=2709310 RepID=A0A6B3R0K6_9FLAO|nr:response regulator [Psychroflexus aurantiacus]NEV93722.1 response regulator [Psychroflexus aurantiacus]
MKTKILLLDDDFLINFINKKYLKNEYPVKDTYDFMSASLALDFLRSEGVDKNLLYIIFLDINMTEMDGWEFMDILQSDFSSLNFEIHMLSSSISEEDKKRAEGYHFVNSYIDKPLNKSKLLPILESISS